MSEVLKINNHTNKPVIFLSVNKVISKHVVCVYEPL